MDRYVYLIFNRTTSENNINTSNNDSFIIWILSDDQLWSGVIKSIIKHFGLHRSWSPPSVFNYPILFKKWVFFYKMLINKAYHRFRQTIPCLCIHESRLRPGCGWGGRVPRIIVFSSIYIIQVFVKEIRNKDVIYSIVTKNIRSVQSVFVKLETCKSTTCILSCLYR